MDPLVQKFRRAAEQRFTAAEVLFKASLNLEATYIAGYAVECCLKALILAGTPPADRKSVLADEFRGRVGHSYQRLRHLLRKKGNTIPRDIERMFIRVASWFTDLRYEVNRLPADDARDFLEASLAILKWTERCL